MYVEICLIISAFKKLAVGSAETLASTYIIVNCESTEDSDLKSPQHWKPKNLYEVAKFFVEFQVYNSVSVDM